MLKHRAAFHRERAGQRLRRGRCCRYRRCRRCCRRSGRRLVLRRGCCFRCFLRCCLSSAACERALCLRGGNSCCRRGHGQRRSRRRGSRFGFGLVLLRRLRRGAFQRDQIIDARRVGNGKAQRAAGFGLGHRRGANEVFFALVRVIDSGDVGVECAGQKYGQQRRETEALLRPEDELHAPFTEPDLFQREAAVLRFGDFGAEKRPGIGEAVGFSAQRNDLALCAQLVERLRRDHAVVRQGDLVAEGGRRIQAAGAKQQAEQHRKQK